MIYGEPPLGVPYRKVYPTPEPQTTTDAFVSIVDGPDGELLRVSPSKVEEESSDKDTAQLEPRATEVEIKAGEEGQGSRGEQAKPYEDLPRLGEEAAASEERAAEEKPSGVAEGLFNTATAEEPSTEVRVGNLDLKLDVAAQDEPVQVEVHQLSEQAHAEPTGLQDAAPAAL